MIKNLILLLALFCSSHVFADTHYMAPSGTGVDSGTCSIGSPCLTLTYSFTQMAAGDTLQIADGVYTGASNVINTSSYPPTGISKVLPTILKAENNGGVQFDGEYTRDMFLFSGTPGGYAYIKWWKFEGIQWVRALVYPVNISNGDASDFTTGDLAGDPTEVMFKSCGFHGTGNSINLSYVNSMLFEDTYTWGKGRYGYNFYICDDIIVRRNVDRRDDLNAVPSDPASSYISYASHRVEYQNCISIDVDNTLWDEGEEGESYHDPYGGFYARNSFNSRITEDTHYNGCMVINFNSSKLSKNNTYLSGWYIQADPSGTELNHCIVWGSTKGIITSGTPIVSVDHCTVGSAANQSGGTQQYCFGALSNSDGMTVTNSVAYNNSFLRGFYQNKTGSNYNNAYGNDNNTVDGGNSTTTDPLNLYQIRVEANSPNYNTGSTGNKGATIVKRFGTDGAFYGDSGYATITDIDLWPWPGENIIRTAFIRDYGTTTETRGFCSGAANPRTDTGFVTLTSYILELEDNTGLTANIYGKGTTTIDPTGTAVTIGAGTAVIVGG